MDDFPAGAGLERHQMTEDTLRALDMPGGEEILERMASGQMPVADGLVALLMLTGDYVRLRP